ncbi:hypothetical protein EYF80_008625 [Liparis tanakae]|uniref:Uncharacterized protein n=1 Tax=Liparis tanakae TaxID=230148 RepID=A0A4Z2ISI7_9TELE|nr:hypothetical protein EYF80_008625 [Liparis tanakae]
MLLQESPAAVLTPRPIPAIDYQSRHNISHPAATERRDGGNVSEWEGGRVSSELWWNTHSGAGPSPGRAAAAVLGQATSNTDTAMGTEI